MVSGSHSTVQNDQSPYFKTVLQALERSFQQSKQELDLYFGTIQSSLELLDVNRHGALKITAPNNIVYLNPQVHTFFDVGYSLISPLGEGSWCWLSSRQALPMSTSLSGALKISSTQSSVRKSPPRMILVKSDFGLDRPNEGPADISARMLASAGLVGPLQPRRVTSLEATIRGLIAYERCISTPSPSFPIAGLQLCEDDRLESCSSSLMAERISNWVETKSGHYRESESGLLRYRGATIVQAPRLWC